MLLAVPNTRARAVARTEALLIGGLLLLIVLAWGAERAFAGAGPVHLGDVPSLVLCLVPALLWLGYFYLQDRHEPEPKEFVLGVYLLGAFVAWPLARYTQGLWPAAATGGPLTPKAVFFAIVPGGLAQELAKYLVVRYSVYMSDEFDEPMDGIVYMMACGTGFAVWVNYHRLSGQHHEVYLSIGAAQAVVTTLAHASFAGVLGYVMGRAKFSRRRALARGILLMLGLLLAAAFNGQFTLVAGWVVQRGLALHPWYGVGYAALSAAAIFGILWLVSRQLLALSPFRNTSV